VGIQLLKFEQIEELRTSSVLSYTPMAQTFQTASGPTSLVAVHNWVLPKNLFVTLWMWYMLDAKVYTAHVDHEVSDQIIAYLNPEGTQSIKKRENQWLNYIFTELSRIYRDQNHNAANKKQIFNRVLDELAA
jgi:hypothetical protein